MEKNEIPCFKYDKPILQDIQRLRNFFNVVEKDFKEHGNQSIYDTKQMLNAFEKFLDFVRGY